MDPTSLAQVIPSLWMRCSRIWERRVKRRREGEREGKDHVQEVDKLAEDQSLGAVVCELHEVQLLGEGGQSNGSPGASANLH
jgi:hypothetical protein